MGARISGLRILSLMAVLVLVSACASKTDETGDFATEGLVMTDRTTVTSGPDTTLNQGTGIMPGSQQDLVVNVGDRVFFGYDQHDLTGEGRGVVERQAQWLKAYPNVQILIEGHADERGTREYNLALGEKRATTIRNYLIANGVEPGRIQTISYGKERPAVTGDGETSWAQNRRGVLVVQ